MFEIVKIINPLKNAFIHTYDGKTFKLNSGATYDFPIEIARDVAYHLAQRVCHANSIPLFGAEFDKEVKKILGMPEEALLPKDELLDDVEEYGNAGGVEVFELKESTPVNTAFSPSEEENKIEGSIIEVSSEETKKAGRPKKI